MSSSCSSLFAFSVLFIYGVLFAVFTKNDEFNDGCGDQRFKDYSLAAAILLLISSGITFIRLIFDCFTSKSSKVSGNDSNNNRENSKKENILNFIAIMLHLGFIIGLTAVDNDQCGQLHKLAMSYYILIYILIAFAIVYNIACKSKK